MKPREWWIDIYDTNFIPERNKTVPGATLVREVLPDQICITRADMNALLSKYAYCLEDDQTVNQFLEELFGPAPKDT